MTQGARDRWVNNYAPQVRAVAQRLATQGIAIYPVQASGAASGHSGNDYFGCRRGEPWPAREKLRPMTRENDLRIWATMDVLADVTGGRSFRNSNDLAAGVRAAATDMRGSYSVGFYVPDNTDNRWREFDVRVRRPGVRVLHRKGYMALAPVKQPLNWTQDGVAGGDAEPVSDRRPFGWMRVHDLVAEWTERPSPNCFGRSLLQSVSTASPSLTSK